MRRKSVLLAALLGAALLLPLGATASAPSFSQVTLSPFVVDSSIGAAINQKWTEQLLATNPEGTWAPLRFEPTDEELALMGFPSKKVLASRRYAEATLVTREGKFIPVGGGGGGQNRNGGGRGNGNGSGGGQDPATFGPPLAAFAGAGWFGIRPGALSIFISSSTNSVSIGWCSLAHVYGSPGAYKISTAGHCGNTGDTATVVAAFGNRGDLAGPVLLDFGKVSTSNKGGLGDDWALIDVSTQPAIQSLVTPTMAFWGGPRGIYTKTGSVASLNVPNRGLPSVAINTTDPLLAQTIVHYGHGLGVHTLVTPLAVSVAGGTGRAGTAVHWGNTHFMFFGYIAPGDSGSGANTALGDTVGANMEAAGIITHIWIDALMRQGLGTMGGTRSSVIGAALSNGQMVPYPAPLPGAP